MMTRARSTGVLLALALTLPTQALAFCGFFVSGADAELNANASQVVLMRHGQTTVMTMSNTYKGPTEDFAMVVPVPVVLQKDQVKTLRPDVFRTIDRLSAPRLVKYWEKDPCAPEPSYGGMGSMGTGKGGGGLGIGTLGRGAGRGVKVEAKFRAGEYEVVILSAKEASGLESWLRLNKYAIPQGASAALAPYIKSGMKFFVAKVDIKRVKRDRLGNVVLSPLQFHFEDKQLRLPVRLGLLNAAGKQDLIVYILHKDKRFKVANYKNVFIPSNLEVAGSVRPKFGAFYAELFDRTLAQAGGQAVVTEYAWQAGKCDPCPVPPLQDHHLTQLGGKVLGLSGADYRAKPPPAKPVRPGKPVPPALANSQLSTLFSSPSLGQGFAMSGAGGSFFGRGSSWVLTRLHTRYDRKTLKQDLIFVPAKPVVGGRGSDGLSREKPGEVKPSKTNNFQARYIMREYWSGKATCDAPKWGQWGGPPRGGKSITPAIGLAHAKRNSVNLRDLVKSKLRRLGLPGWSSGKRRR